MNYPPMRAGISTLHGRFRYGHKGGHVLPSAKRLLTGCAPWHVAPQPTYSVKHCLRLFRHRVISPIGWGCLVLLRAASCPGVITPGPIMAILSKIAEVH